MSMFILVISSLTTSSLPCFMDLTFQVPVQYCSYSIGLYFHHQSHPQLAVVFVLAQRLHSFWSYLLGTYWPVEFIFQCHIFLPFLTVHGVLKARMLKWFALSFSSGQHFARSLHHDPSFLGGPTWHCSQFRLWPTWSVSCPIYSRKIKNGVYSLLLHESLHDCYIKWSVAERTLYELS